MGVLWALGAAVGFGASDFLGGTAARRAAPLPVVVASQGLTALVLLLWLPVAGGDLGLRPLVHGLLGGLAGGVAFLSFYRGLAVGRMGLVATGAALTAAIVPVGAGLALGERPALLAWAGMALAGVAVALVTAARVNPLRAIREGDPGFYLGALAGIGFGGFIILMDRSGPGNAAWPLFVATLTAFVVQGGLTIARRASFRIARPAWGLVAGSGLLNAVGLYCLITATRGGLLTIVAVIVSLAPAPTILLARWLLDERLTRSQSLGVALALCSVVMIAVA